MHATVMPEGIAVLWPPNALLLTAALLLPAARWWVLLPAVLCAEVAADLPVFGLGEALAFALINLGEVLLAAALLRRLGGHPFDLSRLRGVVSFGLIGVLLVPAIAGLFGAGVYHLTRGGVTSFLTFWRIWWFGDGLGLLVLTPALWWLLRRLRRRRRLWPEIRGLLPFVMAAAVIAHLVFRRSGIDLEQLPLTPFVASPVVIWAGLRRGLPAAAWSGLGLAAVAIWHTTTGRGPYAGLEDVAAVLALQEYLSVTLFSALAFAAMMVEMRRQRARAAREARHHRRARVRLEDSRREIEAANRALGRANQELEQRVAERTRRLREANLRLQRLANHDELTGALNRRHFMDLAGPELARTRRYRRPLSLLLWDVDHFKAINDRLGHLAGDRVLVELVRRVQGGLRGGDRLARYGGEEFVVLLPETDLAEAVVVAERLRHSVASAPVEVDGRQARVTASFGIARLEAADEGVEALLSRADAALYRAKAGGRDQVLVGMPEEGSAPASAGGDELDAG